jgi:hypothetical protein
MRIGCRTSQTGHVNHRVSAAAVLIALTIVSLARAAPVAATLSVRRDGAENCPDGATVQASVERILGRSFRSRDDSPRQITAEITFRHSPRGLDAVVRARGARQGERTLTDPGPTCAALAQAVAVTVALLLDERPLQTEASPATSAPATPATSAPSAPATSARPAVQTSAPSAPPTPPPNPNPAPGATSRSARASPLFPIWAGFLTGVSLGQVGAPSFAPGLELGGDFLPSWSARVGAEFVLPRDRPLAPGVVAVSLLGGDVALCRALWQRELVFRTALCAEGSVAALHGTATGYPSTTSSTFLWVALGGRAELEGTIAQWFVWGLEASLLAPVRRQTFSIEPLGIAYESSPIGGAVRLRAALRLW